MIAHFFWKLRKIKMSMPIGTPITRDKFMDLAKEDLEEQQRKYLKRKEKIFAKKLVTMETKYTKEIVEECGSCCNKKFNSDLEEECSIINFPAYEWENKRCRCKNYIFKGNKGI